MNPSSPVNINDRIYYLDVEAFELLQTYLSELHKAFPGEEGKEIVSDIESRISEHFHSLTQGNMMAIKVQDVRNVITILGSASELADEEPSVYPEKTEPTEQNLQKGSNDHPDRYEEAEAPQVETIVITEQVRKKFYRNPNDRMIGGVIGGFSAYFGWNSDIARIICFASLIVPGIGPALFVYALCWLLIPMPKNHKQMLEMMGMPLTLDNLGNSVLTNTGEVTPPPYRGSAGRRFPKLHKFLKIMVQIGSYMAITAGAIMATVCGGAIIDWLISSYYADSYTFSTYMRHFGHNLYMLFAATGGMMMSIITICASIYVLSGRPNIKKNTVITLFFVAFGLIMAGMGMNHDLGGFFRFLRFPFMALTIAAPLTV